VKAEEEGRCGEGEKQQPRQVQKEPGNGDCPPQWGATGRQNKDGRSGRDSTGIEIEKELGKRWHTGDKTPVRSSIFILISLA